MMNCIIVAQMIASDLNDLASQFEPAKPAPPEERVPEHRTPDLRSVSTAGQE